MKKKILILALAVALVAIMVGGSLAYFTAEDEATNTFTIGSVKIEIVEEFQKPDAMIPVVNIDEDDPNYIDKLARVKNIGDNAAYVQMYVAIPQALDETGAFVVVDADNGDWTTRVKVGTTEFETVTYNVYMYRYKSLLDVNTETSNVITAAYLAPQLDYDHDTGKFVMDGVSIDDYTPGESIDIYVGAQAIQAAGFDGYDNALNNFTTHPWAN